MISIGADVAQDKIDICIYDCTQKKVLLEKMILNTRKGFQELEPTLSEFSVKRILVESTGGLEEAFCVYFQNRGPELFVLNPKQVKRFKEACFEDQKTDRIDAKALAHMAILHHLKGSAVMSAEEKRMQSLLRQRHFLVQERTRLVLRKSRLKKLTVHELVIDQLTSLIRTLDLKISKIEKTLLANIESDAGTQERFERLQTIPGIGQKTAFVLMQHLGQETRKFENPEKFCAFAGLYPTKRESGLMKGREKLTSKGCRDLRGALYLAAMTNLTGKSKRNLWKKYYEAKLSQGKRPKQILIAIANKLARAAWLVTTKNWIFDPTKFLPSFA